MITEDSPRQDGADYTVEKVDGDIGVESMLLINHPCSRKDKWVENGHGAPRCSGGKRDGCR